MNRSVAVFVALALLLAHTFAIYVDDAGGFAPPYDRAYVPYRIARNVIYEGALVWNLDQSGWLSYPSLAWIGAAFVPQRLYHSVNLFSQILGITASLGTLMLIATRFSARRSAGLVAPLLLASSGGVAAAGANGMETAFVMLLFTASYTAFEQGWNRRLAIALGLACLAHPWGGMFAALLFLLQTSRRLRGSAAAAAAAEGRESGFAPFLMPCVVLGCVWILRLVGGAPVLSADSLVLLAPTTERLGLGLDYLRDFAAACPAALLTAYPVWYVLRGKLSLVGRHALVLALGWMALVVLSGGGSLPFYEALVPCLPLLFLAVQEGMLCALDCGVTPFRNLAFVLFGLGCAATAFASKAPGNLGPFDLPEVFDEWMEPSREDPTGYERPLGRAGLQREIRETEKLRAIGIFLRDNGQHLSPSETIATPWPGSLGYLSGLRIADLLGRTAPPAGEDDRRPWSTPTRVDLAAALERAPDYLITFLQLPGRAPTRGEVASELVERWDEEHARPERVAEIEELLEAYEMVAVPISVYYRTPPPPRSENFFLLRRRRPERGPVLEVNMEEGAVHVAARHRGHPQLVNLSLTVVDDAGEVYSMRPTGELVPDEKLYARTGHLLYDTGERLLQLARVGLPEHPQEGRTWVELRARLHNPSSPGLRRRADHPFAWVSEEVRLGL